MHTLSLAPDRVVSWSDFSLLYKTVRKLNRIVVQFFHTFTRFVILTMTMADLQTLNCC